MENCDKKLFFADYLDYSIMSKGRSVDSPFERLTFDLLRFYPSSIVITLTSTLIGESTTRFTEYYDFWNNGALKIHLEKGDTADKYLSRKLASAGGYGTHNYEMQLYSSIGASSFINNFLKSELSAKNVDYVIPRTSNADTNNRLAFLDVLGKNERRIIEAPDSPMTMREFDRLALRLETLAYDQSFVFQRSYIIRDLIANKIYKKTGTISKVLLSSFDASYNQAMAQSVNATIISTMNGELNGVGLRNFVMSYSPELFHRIQLMTPSQVFLLAQDKNWQIYRDYICKLYSSLSSKYLTPQESPFYKVTQRIEAQQSLIDQCIEKMAETAFDMMKYSYPNAYSDVQNAKVFVSYYISSIRMKHSKEEQYYSEEIIKRTPIINQICDDILNLLYI